VRRGAVVIAIARVGAASIFAIVVGMPFQTLQIPLEDLHRPEWQERYIGDRKRYATATSVRFVDPNTIVCCALLARKIYLIRFNIRAGSFETIASADTMHAGSTAQTDLCDIDGRGHVITSDCEAASMSLYRYANDQIGFERDLDTRFKDNFCHGARFCGPDVVVAAMHRDPAGMHFFDLQTMAKLLYIKTDHPAKDICFLPNGRAILITTAGSPTATPQDHYTSQNLLVEFDLPSSRYKLLKKQTYPLGQFDSGVVHADKLFVVDSPRGCVLVIDVHTLQQVDQIDGYAFPHGIDINYGMMAITSYGTNSIYVSPLSA
jgi:hypothetical protein